MSVSAFPWSQFLTRSSELRIQNLLDTLNQDTIWKIHSLSRFPYLKCKHHFWLRNDPASNKYVSFNTSNGFCSIWMYDTNSIVVGFKSVDPETKLDIYQAWTFNYNNVIWEYEKILVMVGQGFNALKAYERNMDMGPQ
jgi:hypothetical protein